MYVACVCGMCVVCGVCVCVRACVCVCMRAYIHAYGCVCVMGGWMGSHVRICTCLYTHMHFNLPLKPNLIFHKYVVQVFLSQIAYPLSWQKCCLPTAFDDFRLLPALKNRGQCHALVTSQGLQTFPLLILAIHFRKEKDLGRGLRNVARIAIHYQLNPHAVFDSCKPRCLHCYFERVTAAPNLVSATHCVRYSLPAFCARRNVWCTPSLCRIILRYSMLCCPRANHLLL